MLEGKISKYMFLMTIFAALSMFKIKKLNSTTFKISIGLFFSVIIYYINNFFYVLGSSEKLNAVSSVIIPLIILTMVNSIFMRNINAK